MSFPLEPPYYNYIVFIVYIIFISLVFIFLLKGMLKEGKKISTIAKANEAMNVIVKGLPIQHIQFLIDGKEPFKIDNCIIVDNHNGTHTITITGAAK